MSQRPELTVIVCTFNRAALLSECLGSLTEQSMDSSAFKVMIVDNNSSDRTPEVVRDFGKRLPGLSYQFEPEQGLSHARNSGLRVADTDWCAFLDDDAIAHHDWVERIFSTIVASDFDAFGGVYLPWYRDGKPNWYLDRYASNKHRMPSGGLTYLQHQCFSGGNAVFRRDAALTAGGFPTSIGMSGGELGYGEESALQHEMRARGYRIGFDPDLLIDHLVPKHKQTLDWFRQRSIAEGKSEFERNRRDLHTYRLVRMLFNYLVYDMKQTAQAFARFLSGRYRKENVYIDIIPPLLFQFEVMRHLMKLKRNAARPG